MLSKENAGCGWFSPGPIKITLQKSNIIKAPGARSPSLAPRRLQHPHNIICHPADVLDLLLQASPAWRRAEGVCYPAPLQSLKTLIMVGVGLGKIIVSFLFLNYFLELANDLPWGNVEG